MQNKCNELTCLSLSTRGKSNVVFLEKSNILTKSHLLCIRQQGVLHECKDPQNTLKAVTDTGMSLVGHNPICCLRTQLMNSHEFIFSNQWNLVSIQAWMPRSLGTLLKLGKRVWLPAWPACSHCTGNSNPLLPQTGFQDTFKPLSKLADMSNRHTVKHNSITEHL